MKSYREVYLMVNGLQKKAEANDVPVSTQLLLGASDRALNAYPVGVLNERLGWGPNFTRTNRLNENRDMLASTARSINRPIYGLRPEDRSTFRNMYNKTLQYTNLPAPQVYHLPGMLPDKLFMENFKAARKSPLNFRSLGIFNHLIDVFKDKN